MLSATIGLIVWAGADTAAAEAKAGLAQSAAATPHVVINLITLPDIFTLTP